MKRRGAVRANFKHLAEQLSRAQARVAELEAQTERAVVGLNAAAGYIQNVAPHLGCKGDGRFICRCGKDDALQAVLEARGDACQPAPREVANG